MPYINETYWKKHPYNINGWLAVYGEEVVFSARVNQSTFAYPVPVLTYDTPTGSYIDVKQNQTVKISDSSGNFKGWARVRGEVTSSTQINIGHVSQGELFFEDNDIIEVLNDYRPFMRVPRLDAAGAAIYKDYDLTFSSDFGNYPNPVCVAGPDAAGWVDSITNKLRVIYALGNSFATADAATISTFSADLADGSIVSGSVASGNFTVDFPAGKRWVTLSCIDSNGKVGTAYRTVHAFKAGTYEPLKLASVELTGSFENGWELHGELLDQSADTSVLPEGARIVFFVDENYGSSHLSLNGVQNRENIKFVGYFTNDLIKLEPYSSTYEIYAQGPKGLMQSLTAFPQTITRSASPDRWDKVANLDLQKFIWYLLYWHSTVLQLFDVDAASMLYLANYKIPDRLDAEAGDYNQQIEFAANAAGGHFTADFQGKLWFRKNPQIADASYKGSLATIATINDSDWFDAVNVPTRFTAPLYWLRGAAFISSDSAEMAVMSIAPGTTPGQGSQESIVNSQIVFDQPDLNRRTGYAYALQRNRVPSVQFGVIHGGLVADPAWQEWIVLNITAASNKRGLIFSGTRFLLKEVQIQIDLQNGTTDVHWNVEQEIFGQDGTTIVVPLGNMDDPTITTPTPYVPPDNYDPTTPVDEIAFALAPAVYATDIDGTLIARTLNHTGAAEWEKVLGVEDIVGSISGGTSYSHYFDFTISDQGWTPLAPNATYVSGFGWEPGDPSNLDRDFISYNWGFDASVHKIKVHLSKPMFSDSNQMYWSRNGGGFSQLTVTTSEGEDSWTEELDSHVQVGIEQSAGPTVAYDGYIIGVTIEGNGPDPFLFSSAFRITEFLLDPWNPKRAAYISVCGGAIAKVFYVENLDAAPGAQTITELFSYNTSASTVNIEMVASINFDGAFFCALGYLVGSTYHLDLVKRTNRAGSVTRASITTSADGTLAGLCIDIGKHADTIAHQRMLVGGIGGKLYYSTNGGSSFSLIDTTASGSFNYVAVHFPYDSNPTDNISFAATEHSVTYGATVYKITNGSTFTDITPDFGNGKVGATFGNWGLHTYTQGQNYLSISGTDDTDNRLTTSTNTGGAWTRHDSGTDPVTLLNPAGVGGWPYDHNVLFLFGAWEISSTLGIFWTDDFGATWNDMLGDWATSIGAFVGIQQLAPVWVP
jgi:hypothetical protein